MCLAAAIPVGQESDGRDFDEQPVDDLPHRPGHWIALKRAHELRAACASVGPIRSTLNPRSRVTARSSSRGEPALARLEPVEEG
jgi:hypothetical protein